MTYPTGVFDWEPCDPPIVVNINGRRRIWVSICHTCKPYADTACLACGYRDCPVKDLDHYAPTGCPSCGLF